MWVDYSTKLRTILDINVDCLFLDVKKTDWMTNLSVNINKVATLRNARGENRPCVEQVAVDCEAFGAQGITVHP